MKNLGNVLLIVPIAIGLGLGCLCGSNKAKCEAFLTTDKGNEYYGADKTVDTAIRNSCNNYCIVEDKEFDRLWLEWKDSPAAKKSRLLRGGKLKKVDATTDPNIMDYLYKECAPACVKKKNEGVFKARTKCGGK